MMSSTIMISTMLEYLIFLFILTLPDRIFCINTTYVEEGTDIRLSCKHDVPKHEFYRVRWFKSIHPDYYMDDRDGNLAVASRDNTSHTFTTDNYGIDKDFSLVIYNTSVRNDGLFRCFVSKNIPGALVHCDVKIKSYGKVKSPQMMEIQLGTNQTIPSSYKSAEYNEDSILWYKRNITEYFNSDDQPIASRTDNGIRVLPKYTLTNDSSLGIQNVSFEDEAVFRSISTSPEDTRPTARETNVTVYALPRKKPSIQPFFQAGAFFINCSVDHVYPRLLPELNFTINGQSYDINENGKYNTSISGKVVHRGLNITIITPKRQGENVDGTYNITICGKVVHHGLNITAKCTFPHFNYTEKSSLRIPVNISDKEEGQPPADCPASVCSNHAGSTTGVVLGTLILIAFVILLVVFLWKRRLKKHQQNDVDKSLPEIEPMV